MPIWVGWKHNKKNHGKFYAGKAGEPNPNLNFGVYVNRRPEKLSFMKDNETGEIYSTWKCDDSDERVYVDIDTGKRIDSSKVKDWSDLTSDEQRTYLANNPDDITPEELDSVDKFFREFHILNKDLSKEEYFKKMRDYAIGNPLISAKTMKEKEEYFRKYHPDVYDEEND
jgi:hypothetical protein